MLGIPRIETLFGIRLFKKNAEILPLFVFQNLSSPPTAWYCDCRLEVQQAARAGGIVHFPLVIIFIKLSLLLTHILNCSRLSFHSCWKFNFLSLLGTEIVTCLNLRRSSVVNIMVKYY